MIELFVPGRLCLFGEHSDWAGKYRSMNSQLVAGETIVTGTEQGIYATVERSDNFEHICLKWQNRLHKFCSTSFSELPALLLKKVKNLSNKPTTSGLGRLPLKE